MSRILTSLIFLFFISIHFQGDLAQSMSFDEKKEKPPTLHPQIINLEIDSFFGWSEAIHDYLQMLPFSYEVAKLQFPILTLTSPWNEAVSLSPLGGFVAFENTKDPSLLFPILGSLSSAVTLKPSRKKIAFGIPVLGILSVLQRTTFEMQLQWDRELMIYHLVENKPHLQRKRPL